MEDKIKLLMETTGCNQYEAELAYKSAKGNFVEALDFLNRVSPGLGIIKCKFIITERYIYGMFLIIYDVKQQSILTVSTLVSSNPVIYEFNLSSCWEDMERFIYSNRLEDWADVGLSNKLQEKILSLFEGGIITSDIRDDERFKDIIKEVFSTDNYSMDIDFSTEAYKTQSITDTSTQQDLIKEIPLNKIVITLELIEDPKHGVAAKLLSEGDVVWVRVSDTRDIAEYLFSCMGGIIDGKVVPLACQISSVEKSKDISEENILWFRFTDTIVGYARVSREFKAKVVSRHSNDAFSFTDLLKRLFRG